MKNRITIKEMKELGELNSRILNRIRNMTIEELFQSVVDVGIYNKKGRLTIEYGGRANREKLK